MVRTGLDIVAGDKKFSQKLKGNIACLCHAASVDKDLRHGIGILKNIFGNRFKTVLAPQHGFFADAQDDMIESPHHYLSHFDVRVFSLYSETRMPTETMLENIQYLLIDVQDIGCRPYTYIFTALNCLKASSGKAITIIVLDRPNPIDGLSIEGNILDEKYQSFVGMLPLPMRYGMTLGEILQLGCHHLKLDCDLQIIPMEGWHRSMTFRDTGLPWVLPSPNLPNPETALIFPGSVLFEGTNLSEGRGTTKSLEMIGHPNLNPFEFVEDFKKVSQTIGLEGFVLRPAYFTPVFHKFAGQSCGGFQIHVTDRHRFLPWKTGQFLLRELYHYPGTQFQWKQPPFEYELEKLPIDLINGTDVLRQWVENQGNVNELDKISLKNQEDFLNQRSNALCYQ